MPVVKEGFLLTPSKKQATLSCTVLTAFWYKLILNLYDKLIPYSIKPGFICKETENGLDKHETLVVLNPSAEEGLWNITPCSVQDMHSQMPKLYNSLQ